LCKSGQEKKEPRKHAPRSASHPRAFCWSSSVERKERRGRTSPVGLVGLARRTAKRRGSRQDRFAKKAKRTLLRAVAEVLEGAVDVGAEGTGHAAFDGDNSGAEWEDAGEMAGAREGEKSVGRRKGRAGKRSRSKMVSWRSTAAAEARREVLRASLGSALLVYDVLALPSQVQLAVIAVAPLANDTSRCEACPRLLRPRSLIMAVRQCTYSGG
jgi:hypothetical protein